MIFRDRAGSARYATLAIACGPCAWGTLVAGIYALRGRPATPRRSGWHRDLAAVRSLRSYQLARASVLVIVRSTRSGSRRGGRWSIPGTTVSSHPVIRAAASRLAWISGG